MNRHCSKDITVANNCVKRFNITIYQGNASQNHNEILSHTCQNGYHKKKNTTKVDEDVEKREHSHAVGGNVNLFSHFRKEYRGFSKYYK